MTGRQRQQRPAWKPRRRMRMADVEREALAQQAKPLRQLPESWWDPAVHEAMSDHIKRQKENG